jgi:hypothetical protein
MAKYTLKLIGISESGSIGRQLKATINGVSFGFSGSTSRHEIIAKDVEFSDTLSLPISVDVLEWDAKVTDEPYSTSATITIVPPKLGKPTALKGKSSATTSAGVTIAEVGGAGKNKGKSAGLTFSFAAEVSPDKCKVKLVSADLVKNEIVTEITGPSNATGDLILWVGNSNVSSAYTEILKATRSPGRYVDAFDVSSVPERVQMTEVGVTYTCDGINYEDDVSYHFKSLGKYHHTQYNTPNEGDSTCKGAPVKVCITGIANGKCVYQEGSLKSLFESQVRLNGSGVSAQYGAIASEGLCKNPPAHLKSLHRYRANYPRKAPCKGGALDNTTVARDPNDKDLTCGAKICLVGSGSNGSNIVKTVTDICPACKGKKQIDNYTTDPRCSGISDLGNFITVKLGKNT